jgi:hypothetical protein
VVATAVAALLFALTAIAPPSSAVAAGNADIAAPEREIRIGFIERDGLKGIEARFTILRDCRAIWKTLVDYRNYAEIFEGNLRAPRVLEESDAGATVEFWVDAKLRNSNFVLRRSYDAYCRKISWRKISGDALPERIEGSWLIEPGSQPGESTVTYRSFIKIAWFVPMGLSRRLASTSTADMARRLRDWVESREEP